ncbi:MAG: hypothetical protein M0D55_14910 [Elusimicrobiota bacterium]|nr:MAG: hypothetical protein M0D55_14910 [Elusimicrobiota bacterium]
MKNVLAALALAVLAAPAFAGGEAVAQLRGAAADHRAGATSYDGGYAGEESGAIAGRRTPEQLPTLSGVVPTAAVKAPEKAEVPKPDCPRAPTTARGTRSPST